MNKQKLILASCGVALAIGVLIFSVTRSGAPEKMPVVQPGEHARTEDAPELGVTAVNPH